MADVALEKNASVGKMWTKEKKIGEGTYATVFEGREVATGRKIAIKKIKLGQFKDGISLDAIREIKFLRELRHENVIELLSVYSAKANINLVLEFCQTDLEYLIKNKTLLFLPGDVKSWMQMTLRGLEFCHRNGVLHRDLKPNNLFITSEGVLKVADFGLAREFGDGSMKMTPEVITTWYRPPELLFGARAYSSSVDIWSVGCIFAELMLRVPFFAGASNLDQLKIMYSAMGSPTEAEWPNLKTLPDYVQLDFVPRKPWHLHFSAASPDAITMLKGFLAYNPNKRVSAKEALLNPYFHTSPYPTHPSKLPLPTPGTGVARILAPELNGQGQKHVLKDKKRKKGVDEDDEEDGEGSGTKKVARKLTFG
ncbi:kinase-like domain-containing protein [Mrakia frigida]|uniref:TFIIH complex serine/threonine-protein kinase subunit KIN28 n=1 Tax=Mrakia frigida TaxID=29902 RepID=UPI003FCC0980